MLVLDASRVSASARWSHNQWERPSPATERAGREFHVSGSY
jgi:hypothetical protein